MSVKGASFSGENMTKFEEWVELAPVGARLYYGAYVNTSVGPQKTFIEKNARATARRLFAEGKVLLFRQRSDSCAFGLDYVAVRCSSRAAQVFGEGSVYDSDRAARKWGYPCQTSSS